MGTPFPTDQFKPHPELDAMLDKEADDFSKVWDDTRAQYQEALVQELERRAKITRAELQAEMFGEFKYDEEDALKSVGYAPGDYYCTCRECKHVFIGDKRARCCRPCAERKLQCPSR